MTDRIKTAFDAVQAEPSLKERTLHTLRAQINAQTPRRRAPVRRAIAAAACLLLLLSGVFTSHLYFTEAAYISLDINPSLELAINQFDRVIGTRAYNADAEALLGGLGLLYRGIDTAIDDVIAAAAQTGALQREEYVSVTVHALSSDDAQLLARVQMDVLSAVSHHGGAQTDVFSVNDEVRAAAQELHVSPAKYLAILALQEVAPATSVEECRNHTIGELRQLTTQHHGAENGQGGPNRPATENPTPGSGAGNPVSGNSGNPTPGHHGYGHR